jgi:hypothetical protein
MVNPTRPPKHKPNEKHTLDEVLKSLNDLVRGEVLDKAGPPPAPAPKKASEPPPMADMSDIIRSLESLLDNDLGNKPAAKATPTIAPATPVHQSSPAPTPTIKPAIPVAPARTKDRTADPDYLSEAEIIKALEEINFDSDTDVAPVPAAAMDVTADDLTVGDAFDMSVLETIDIPSTPDSETAAVPETIVTPEAVVTTKTIPSEEILLDDVVVTEETIAPLAELEQPEPPAPTLELAMQEPVGHTPGTQHELSFGAPQTPKTAASEIEEISAPDVAIEETADAAAAVLEQPAFSVDENEITAEPIADEIILDAPGIPESATEPAAFQTEEIEAPLAPSGELSIAEEEITAAAPPGEGEFDAPEEKPAEASLADELASIDFSTDGLEFDAAPKPPSDSFSIDFTPSKKSAPVEPIATPIEESVVAAEAPAPAEEAITIVATEPAPPETQEPEAEEIEAATPPEPTEETAVTEIIADAPEEPAPAPEPDYSDIIERAEPPITPVGGGKSLGSLGEFMELDMSASDTSPLDGTTLSDLSEMQAAPTLESTTAAPETAAIDLNEAPSAAAPALQEIPVLKNVAAVPSAENFTLEHSPPPAPKTKSSTAAGSDLHQTAVRVIAKLNIELRKSGKPPLDAKAINRLQQLLKEALEKKPGA